MSRDDQTPLAHRHQGVAVPRRNRHPALGIEIERRRTLKHRISPGREISRYATNISH
ncbi:MAG: hypothetical protein NTV11_05045 [Rhodocyclales bacterium]|nr:hypothetical protein [Rhodocyclales bacterium]